jgi:hypothetical protein
MSNEETTINLPAEQSVSYGDKFQWTMTQMVSCDLSTPATDAELLMSQGSKLPQEIWDTLTYSLTKENKRLNNVRRVTEKAKACVAADEAVSDEKVNDDWLNRFNAIIEEISDDTMQNVWALILSGEIKQPKSFSLRTLDVVKNMTKEEADLYVNAMQYMCLDHFVLTETEYGMNLDDVIRLIDMGVMSPDDLERSVSLNKGDNIIGMDHEHILIAKNESEGKILVKFKGRRLTKAGEEMENLVKDKKDNLELYKFVAEKLKKAGASQVSIHKVVARKGQGQVEYLIEPDYKF